MTRYIWDFDGEKSVSFQRGARPVPGDVNEFASFYDCKWHGIYALKRDIEALQDKLRRLESLTDAEAKEVTGG